MYDDYYEHGVMIIPKVFDKKEMDFLRLHAMLAVKGSNKKYKYNFIEHAPSGDPALMFWPSLANQVMDNFRVDYRLMRIVQDILGPNVRQLNNQFYFRYPNDGDSFAWHTDKRFRNDEEVYPNIGDGYLQTAIIVDDWTEENGAVEYIKGSHKKNLVKGGVLRGFKRRNLKGEKMFPKSGDVVIWSVLVVHGSEENKSEYPRSYYMNGFAKTECAHEFPYYLQNGCPVALDINLIP